MEALGGLKSVQVLLGILCCVRREAFVPSMLNFTVAFNSLSYLQLPKECFTNFDRGNIKSMVEWAALPISL